VILSLLLEEEVDDDVSSSMMLFRGLLDDTAVAAAAAAAARSLNELFRLANSLKADSKLDGAVDSGEEELELLLKSSAGGLMYVRVECDANYRKTS